MRQPAAVTAVTEALSALCDAIEFIRADQLRDALHEQDFDGVVYDGRIAAEWLLQLMKIANAQEEERRKQPPET